MEERKQWIQISFTPLENCASHILLVAEGLGIYIPVLLDLHFIFPFLLLKLNFPSVFLHCVLFFDYFLDFLNFVVTIKSQFVSLFDSRFDNRCVMKEKLQHPWLKTDLVSQISGHRYPHYLSFFFKFFLLRDKPMKSPPIAFWDSLANDPVSVGKRMLTWL